MPLYEYVCADCGTFFEQWVRSASSKEAIACPQCQSAAVDKKFSTFGMKGGASAGSSMSTGDNCSTGGG